MKEGHHIEVGVVDEDAEKWTYYAKFIHTDTGEIKAQVSGLKITKFRAWLKEFK